MGLLGTLKLIFIFLVSKKGSTGRNFTRKILQEKQKKICGGKTAGRKNEK